MVQDETEGLRKMARAAEVKIAEGLLRWRYKKEGKPVPGNPILKNRSEHLAQEARRIMSKKAKNILEELKEAYRKGRKEGG